MPGYAEIALKVTANVRDAVRGIETVDKAIERTDKKIRSISERTRGRLERGGRLIGDVASGRSLGSIAEEFLPQAGIAGLAAQFVLMAQRGLEKFFDEKIAQAQRNLQQATSGPEAGAAFLKGVRTEVEAEKQTTSPLVTLFRQVRGDNQTKAQARENFRELAQTDPLLAGAVLANLPPELEGMRGELEAILRQEQQKSTARETFRTSLQPSRSNATVVQQTTNVYSSFSGLGGEANVGREVRAVLDRRDRNNGRYVTPYTRR